LRGEEEDPVQHSDIFRLRKATTMLSYFSKIEKVKSIEKHTSTVGPSYLYFLFPPKFKQYSKETPKLGI